MLPDKLYEVIEVDPNFANLGFPAYLIIDEQDMTSWIMDLTNVELINEE